MVWRTQNNKGGNNLIQWEVKEPALNALVSADASLQHIIRLSTLSSLLVREVLIPY